MKTEEIKVGERYHYGNMVSNVVEAVALRVEWKTSFSKKVRRDGILVRAVEGCGRPAGTEFILYPRDLMALRPDLMGPR